MTPRLAIVIVSFNARSELVNCLLSLKKAPPAKKQAKNSTPIVPSARAGERANQAASGAGTAPGARSARSRGNPFRTSHAPTGANNAPTSEKMIQTVGSRTSPSTRRTAGSAAR